MHTDKNNNVFNQKKERPIIVFALPVFECSKKNNPPQPISTVIVSWQMLPAMDNETDLILLPSFIKSMRPPYSPILFGVFNESVTPAKTDLNATR